METNAPKDLEVTLDKLAQWKKWLKSKGLMVCTPEEVIRWRTMLELPEETPSMCSRGEISSLPPDPSNPLPGFFVISTLDHRTIAVTRMWNDREKEWNWWEERDGDWWAIPDSQVTQWMKIPDIPEKRKEDGDE